jgi:hypothetical protein
MRILPDRSEIKKILRANCVKLEYDCADCADDLFNQSKLMDIDALAEEWLYDISGYKPNQYNAFEKFSSFIAEQIGGK